MRRSIWIGLLGVLAFLLILLVRLPAAWLSGFLPTEVTCSGLSGTAWNGACAGLTAYGRAVGNLKWQLHPTALLGKKISARIDLEGAAGTGAADLIVDDSSIDARALRGDFALDPALIPQLPRDLRGRVRADLARLRMENGVVTAVEGRVNVTDLERRLSKVAKLGDYTLTFPSTQTVSTGEPVADLVSAHAPWSIEGTLRLTRAPGFEIKGTIAVGPDAPPELVRDLGYLGPPDSRGRRPFSLEGTL